MDDCRKCYECGADVLYGAFCSLECIGSYERREGPVSEADGWLLVEAAAE